MKVLNNKKYYTIYRIINILNNKIYIGVHKTDNLFDDYFGSGKYLINAINKHGIENFHKEIMQIFQTKEEMFEMEELLVTEEFINRKDTYNIKAGGSGGFDHVNNNRLNVYGKNGQIGYGGECLKNGKELKLFLLKKGTYNEWCNNISKSHKRGYKSGRLKNPFTDCKHTAETKRKIGEKNSIHQKGIGNSQYGKCWIYNLVLEKNKSIKKEELEKYLSAGWNTGRRMKF